MFQISALINGFLPYLCHGIFFLKVTPKIKVSVEIINDLSNLNFNGEGETTFFEHTARFLEFCMKNNIHCEEVACKFFTLTFEGCVREWCYTLHVTSIQSFKHLSIEFYHDFDRYDYKYVFNKIVRL